MGLKENVMYQINEYVRNERKISVLRDAQDFTETAPIYFGEFTLNTPQGAVAARAEIQAETLEEAFTKYDEAVAQAVEEIQTQVRQAQGARRLIIPQAQIPSPRHIRVTPKEEN